MQLTNDQHTNWQAACRYHIHFIGQKGLSMQARCRRHQARSELPGLAMGGHQEWGPKSSASSIPLAAQSAFFRTDQGSDQ